MTIILQSRGAGLGFARSRAAITAVVAAWFMAAPPPGAVPCAGQGVPPDFLSPMLTLNAQGHNDLIEAMIFSPDGKFLLTGGRDKVVHVWELNHGAPRLDRSIRPTMRRRGGRVHALAISSRADARGERLLAVAGISAIGARGGILIYRFPGRINKEAGDLAFELPSGRIETPAQQRLGHAGAVNGLAFSPDGRHLASCGQDKTIRVWDLEGDEPKTAAILEGHAGEVRKLAFLDGERIVSGGGAQDGTVRLWNWPRRQLLNTAVCSDEDLAADRGLGVTVSALATSPDGRWVVVGRENGKLQRFDGADLGNQALLNPDEAPRRRAVEGLAFSPDGQTLASSILNHNAKVDEYPRLDCEIALRKMPGGEEVKPIRMAKGLVRALAFSPDGRFLATAGGAEQEVVLRDLQREGDDDPRLRAPGPGSVLWSAGFIDAKPTVAFSRTRAAGEARPAWEAFDLLNRRFEPVAPDTPVQTAVQSVPGWKFAPRAFDQVAFEPDEGEPIAVTLSPAMGRWSSFTFIPPNAAAGHPKLCAALAVEDGGILIFSLPDGEVTRLLLGHGGPALAMAPSADGRWLLTASADMTLGLWSLNGLDVRAALGATIAPDPQGRGGLVQAVSPRSAAERMGLKVGDVIQLAARTGRAEPMPIDRIDAELAEFAPSLDEQARFLVIRPGAEAPIPMATSRADAPVLSLFPGSDREWVVWMPEGFYETSIAGDQRLLGWHLNHLDTSDPNRFLPLSSEFFPMSRYEAQLRKPEVLDVALKTGDAAAALEEARGAPVVQKPPTIRVLEPQALGEGREFVTAEPELTLRIQAEASPNRRVRSLVVHGDLVRYPAHVIEPAAAVASASQRIQLRPDRNVLTIEATDDSGVVAIENFEARLSVPQPPAPSIRRRPRLLIRSIGVESFQERGVPSIRHAERDAEELAAFFREPDGRIHFAEDLIDARVHPGTSAGVDAASMLQVFDEIAEEARNGSLIAGDTVVLVLESHVLGGDSAGSIVLSTDSTAGAPSERALSTAAVSERLEEATARGCLVMMLIDGLHGGPFTGGSAAIREWVRDLSGKRGVIVLVASKQDPSERLAELGAFARAVLEVSGVSGGADADRLASGAPMTLYDFQHSVLRLVSELTSRRQFAGFYPPETLPGWSKIRVFEPQKAPVNDLVGR